LLGEAAIFTASVLPDDTCAVWSKRSNEEANPKEASAKKTPPPRSAMHAMLPIKVVVNP
jgi:hypothetical protein